MERGINKTSVVNVLGNTMFNVGVNAVSSIVFHLLHNGCVA